LGCDYEYDDINLLITFKELFGFQHQVASGLDMEKVKTTIKQFYRDWSAEVIITTNGL